MEVVALQVYDDEVLARGALPALLSLRLVLASRTPSHAALVMENISRTSWLAAAKLHRDPGAAQAAANRLEKAPLDSSS